MVKTAPTRRQATLIQKELDKIIFPTRFKFLLGHYGIRPGNLTGLIGTTGSGKSSLFKTIAVDIAEHQSILFWLSEETAEEYQPSIYRITENGLVEKNIKYFEEKDLDSYFFQNIECFLENFRDIVLESNCKVVFVDNLTTSFMYSDEIGPRGQTKVAKFLNKFAKDSNIAIVYTAHTGSGIFDNMSRFMTSEDVRGSRQIAIQTEYLYLLQKFTIKEEQYKVVRVSKFRHHDQAAGYFLLNWDKSKRCYTHDKKVDFETVNKIFNDRDRLGKFKKKKKESVFDRFTRNIYDN